MFELGQFLQFVTGVRIVVLLNGFKKRIYVNILN